MMNKLFKQLIALGALLMLLTACSNTKYLEPGQILYTGAKVKVNPDSKNAKNQRTLRKQLEERTRPEPNFSILGLRPKLWVYNIMGEPKKEKGPRYWLKYKFGEEPVLMRDVDITYNTQVLRSYLMSKGYLQGQVSGDSVIKGKKGEAHYVAETGIQYTLNEVHYPTESSAAIDSLISGMAEKSLLKKGDAYDLDNIKLERVRLDDGLKQQGYFFFNPEYLIVDVDSTLGNGTVNMWVNVKNNTPVEALKPYFINNIAIYPNYTLEQDSVIHLADRRVWEDFVIIDPEDTYNPKIWKNLVRFNKGEIYNRRDHSLTLNRLVNIGTFKFVKAEFEPVDTFRSNLMDLDIILTSLKKRSMSSTLTGITKSNNFVGSELKINNLNRNLFRGAESLQIGLGGGFEQQISGQVGGVRSYSLTANARLTFPRFLVPFISIRTGSSFVPKTHINASYQFLNRALYYTLNSANFDYGYNWKESQTKEHIFNPVFVNFIRPINLTDSFNTMLVKLPSLRNTFEKQFIIGSNYTFNYNNQMISNKRNHIFFQGNAESAGNLASLFAKKDATGEKALFGSPLNQYIRLEVDFRDYFKLTPSLTLAGRVNLGWSNAYGAYDMLPFVKQFFGGGTNDVRAFRARSLGPGRYYANLDSTILFADQGGDMKALFSGEARFKIWSIFHGALFADAGNVWLHNEDTMRIGSGFDRREFLNDLAIGGGVGVRIDASIFVVRLDLAWPWKVPWRPKGQQWLIGDMNFFDRQWRKENLILNVGIGYPF